MFSLTDTGVSILRYLFRAAPMSIIFRAFAVWRLTDAVLLYFPHGLFDLCSMERRVNCPWMWTEVSSMKDKVQNGSSSSTSTACPAEQID